MMKDIKESQRKSKIQDCEARSRSQHNSGATRHGVETLVQEKRVEKLVWVNVKGRLHGERNFFKRVEIK